MRDARMRCAMLGCDAMMAEKDHRIVGNARPMMPCERDARCAMVGCDARC